MSEDGPLGGMFNPAAPDPRDPAAVAAAHAEAAEAAQREAASRPAAGAHRATHQPSRMLLPALIAFLGIGALTVGVIGWVHSDSPDQSGLVTRPSATASGPGSSSAPPSVSASPSSTASEQTSEAPTPSSTPSATPTPSATAPVVVVRAPSVVLNQTRTVGLAARVAARLRADGWTVTGTGNWRGVVVSTTVYYPPGFESAARSLARVLGVDRVRPRVAGMLTNRLTVVLTGDPFA